MSPERMSMGELLHKIKNVIASAKDIPYSQAKQEVPVGRGSSDIVVYDKSGAPALIFELKQADGSPVHDPYYPDVVEQGCNYASKLGISYFVTSNFKHFVVWKTFQEGTPLLERQLLHYDAAPQIEATIKQILSDLVLLKEGKIRFLSPDAKFVRRLKTFYEILWPNLLEDLKEKIKKDKKFKSDFIDQLYELEFSYTPEAIEKIIKQYSHLLSNKIFFYKFLESSSSKLEKRLPKLLNIETDSSDIFKQKLNGCFKEALEIDYEAVFSSTFFDNIPIDKESIRLFNQFILELEKYRLSEIDYDIIGKVFESLIPIEERHYLGQYYTRADVVDFIEAFCIKSADDTVFDPSCGSGTFLVRAYYHLKEKAKQKRHKELLSQIYGTDINQFPAHLSVINLTLRDSSELTNKVNVLVNDFFNLRPTSSVLLPFSGKNIRNKSQKIAIPKFDAIVGNPPYTRQEELGEYSKTYKSNVLEAAIADDWGKDYSLGKRAGIHAYFMLHAPRFLKSRGRLGFIVSNSWMDADYGKEIQRMLLENFRIKAIIESKAERWFEDAAINTCILIAEKEENGALRNQNIAKFVLLKKNLLDYSMNELVRTIEQQKEFYEDGNLRIYCTSQGGLLQEGYLPDEKGKPEWCGAKWGKYLRAPSVFFKILSQKDKLKPLIGQAEIRRGYTTGCNDFFYLSYKSAKSFGIERQFLEPLLRTKDFKRVIARDQDSDNYVLVINQEKPELRNTNAGSYIYMGEVKKFNQLSTCKSRKRWYDVGKREPAAMFWSKLTYQRHIVPHNKDNAFVDCNVYEITPKDKTKAKALCAILNSNLYALFAELNGQKGLGEGANAMMVYDVERMPVIDVSKLGKEQIKKLENAFMRLSRRDIRTIPEEIASEDHQALDNVVFDIFGLSRKERKEIYSALIDLVTERTTKAKSVKKSGNGNVKKKEKEDNGNFALGQKTLFDVVF